MSFSSLGFKILNFSFQDVPTKVEPVEKTTWTTEGRNPSRVHQEVKENRAVIQGKIACE